MSSRARNDIILNQHGFIHGRSATANLFAFVKYVPTEVWSWGQGVVVCCDLSTAFYVVSHLLLYKNFATLTLPIHCSHYCIFVDVTAPSTTTRSTPACTGPQAVCYRALLLYLFCSHSFSMMFWQKLILEYLLFLLFADDIKTYKVNDSIWIQHWCNATSPSFRIGGTVMGWYVTVQMPKRYRADVKQMTISPTVFLNRQCLIYETFLWL